MNTNTLAKIAIGLLILVLLSITIVQAEGVFEYGLTVVAYLLGAILFTGVTLDETTR